METINLNNIVNSVFKYEISDKGSLSDLNGNFAEILSKVSLNGDKIDALSALMQTYIDKVNYDDIFSEIDSLELSNKLSSYTSSIISSLNIHMTSFLSNELASGEIEGINISNSSQQDNDILDVLIDRLENEESTMGIQSRGWFDGGSAKYEQMARETICHGFVDGKNAFYNTDQSYYKPLVKNLENLTNDLNKALENDEYCDPDKKCKFYDRILNAKTDINTCIDAFASNIRSKFGEIGSDQAETGDILAKIANFIGWCYGFYSQYTWSYENKNSKEAEKLLSDAIKIYAKAMYIAFEKKNGKLQDVTQRLANENLEFVIQKFDDVDINPPRSANAEIAQRDAGNVIFFITIGLAAVAACTGATGAAAIVLAIGIVVGLIYIFKHNPFGLDSAVRDIGIRANQANIVAGNVIEALAMLKILDGALFDDIGRSFSDILAMHSKIHAVCMLDKDHPEATKIDCSGKGWIEVRTCDKCGASYMHCTKHGITEPHTCGDSDDHDGPSYETTIIEVETHDPGDDEPEWPDHTTCYNENCANPAAHVGANGSWIPVYWDASHDPEQ